MKFKDRTNTSTKRAFTMSHGAIPRVKISRKAMTLKKMSGRSKWIQGDTRIRHKF
jgi:hypothetical protein